MENNFIYLQGEGTSLNSSIQMITPKQLTERDLLRMLFRNQVEGLDDISAEEFIDAIIKYKLDPKDTVYDKLPIMAQKYIDGLCLKISKKNKRYANREYVAKQFLNNILHNKMIERSFDQIIRDMQTEIIKVKSEIKNSILNAYDKLFDSIEEIREEDPEKAKKVEELKKAMDHANNFELQRIYMINDRIKNVKRYHMHYNSDTEEFNKKINTTNIVVPDICLLYDTLKKNLPKDCNSTDQIKGFIVLLIRSIIKLDLTDIPTIAYAYRLIDRIYEWYIFHKDTKADPEVFKQVASLIREMDEIKKTKK